MDYLLRALCFREACSPNITRYAVMPTSSSWCTCGVNVPPLWRYNASIVSQALLTERQAYSTPSTGWPNKITQAVTSSSFQRVNNDDIFYQNIF